MRILPICGGILLAMLGMAQAKAGAPTVLTVSANGSNTVAPDQMVASLDVQSNAASAAQAQAAVNRAMKQALAAARGTAGMTATTGDYSVYQNSPDNGSAAKTVYQASQSLSLSMAAPDGIPPAPFTSLVGQLQSQGLLLNSLDGNLSAAGQAAANQGAIDDAIHQIQAQAAAVAATLGEHVGRVQSLNVNLNSPGPVMRAPMMMMAAAAAPPPQAAPGKVTIQANVTATIELTPP
jgi:uncharacterized protein YggE